MDKDDPTLYVLTSSTMLAESLVLWTQKLSTFSKIFLWVLLTVQGLTLISVWKEINWFLRFSHVVFGSSLILGSLFIENKYLLLLIAGVILISQSVRLYQKRCAYHSHVEEMKCTLEYYFMGCIPANAIYIVSFIVIVTRYLMGDLKE